MDKQHAHQLLDQLDPSQFEALVRLLEVMTDPETASIRTAPIDDEPVTEEEERAVAASKEWFKNNRGIPMEEVASELGLTMEQIRGHQGPA
jgi:predicted transcriptional regulator